MDKIPSEAIPEFWREPWRFAAPAWRTIYGAPPFEFDGYAERLVFGGWAAHFGLSRQWRAPGCEGWRAVLEVVPPLLRQVVTALGYIALMRACAPQRLLQASRDPASAWAWKYRAVNCVKSALSQPLPLSGDRCAHLEIPGAHECGVSVLRAMARQDWPVAESRIAMLGEPEPSTMAKLRAERTLPNHRLDLERSRHADRRSVLIVEHVDVRRCLSICGAIARQMTADRR